MKNYLKWNSCNEYCPLISTYLCFILRQVSSTPCTLSSHLVQNVHLSSPFIVNTYRCTPWSSWLETQAPEWLWIKAPMCRAKRDFQDITTGLTQKGFQHLSNCVKLGVFPQGSSNICQQAAWEFMAKSFQLWQKFPLQMSEFRYSCISRRSASDLVGKKINGRWLSDAASAGQGQAPNLRGGHHQTWCSTPWDGMNVVIHLSTGGTGRLGPRSRRRDACRAPSKGWDLRAVRLAWGSGPAAEGQWKAGHISPKFPCFQATLQLANWFPWHSAWLRIAAAADVQLVFVSATPFLMPVPRRYSLILPDKPVSVNAHTPARWISSTSAPGRREMLESI